MEGKSKKSRGPSPTSRTLAFLKSHGWTAGVVERRLPIPVKPGEKPSPFNKRTVDLHNIIDIVCNKPLAPDGSGGVLGVQVTSQANVSARVAKIKAEPRAVTWLKSGALLECHGWKLDKAARRWRCRITPIRLADLGSPEEAAALAESKAARKVTAGRVVVAGQERIEGEAAPLFKGVEEKSCVSRPAGVPLAPATKCLPENV